MNRTRTAAGALLLAATLLTTSTGCRMCASPYDTCGPMFTGRPGECCDPSYRAGSILSPGAMPVGPHRVADEEWVVPLGQGGLPAEPPEMAAPSGSAKAEWVARPPRARR